MHTRHTPSRLLRILDRIIAAYDADEPHLLAEAVARAKANTEYRARRQRQLHYYARNAKSPKNRATPDPVPPST